MNGLVNDLVNVHLKGFVNTHLSDLVTVHLNVYLITRLNVQLTVHLNGHNDSKARSNTRRNTLPYFLPLWRSIEFSHC